MIDHEILGLALSLTPFGNKNSPNRNGMFALAMSQYQLPIEGESPNIFTGLENTLPKYEHNFGYIENDFEVLDIVPKYPHLPNFPSIQSPSQYILGRDLETDEITYYEYRSYHKLNEKYGYSCQPIHTSLNKYQRLKKGEKLYTSKANDIVYGEYKFGCNANTMFASLIGTVEDAFIVSDEFAKKITPEGFKSIKMKLKITDHPLNINGNSEEFKILPDIGEKVKKDGIIAAFRPLDDISIISDFNKSNLSSINRLLDLVFYSEIDGKVVDIDIYFTPKALLNISLEAYEQLIKYHESKLERYRRIILFYLQYKDQYSVSRKLNTLVTRCIKYLYLHDHEFINKHHIFKIKKKNMKMSGEIEDNDIYVNVVIQFKKPVNIGSKITGRDGAKGVIGTIVPKEWMPTDEQGFTADLIIDPISVVSRTNPTQWYESFICRVNDLIKNQSKNIKNPQQRFQYIVEYINDINPHYANILKNSVTNIDEIQEYLDYIDKHDIKLQIIPSMENINTQLIMDIAKKYNVKISPVRFKYEFNGKIKEVITKDAICIGKKFILLDYNEPEISAVNIGNVNTFMVPSTTSAKTKNYTSPFKVNCIRFGEDEFRMMLNTLGPEITVRLKSLSTSIEGLNTIVDTLLTAEKPSDINHFPIHTKDLLNSDVMVNAIHTICNSFGLDLQNVGITKKDIHYYQQTILQNQHLLYNEIEEDEYTSLDNENIDEECEGGVIDEENI